MLYRKSLTALLALALTVGLTACSSKPPEEPEPPESQPSVSVMAHRAVFLAPIRKGSFFRTVYGD